MTTAATSTRGTPAARWLAGLLVAVLPLLFIVQTYRSWRDRLPDPMPSHWNASGQVDGTTSLSGMLTTAVVIAGAGVFWLAVPLGLLGILVTTLLLAPATSGALAGGIRPGSGERSR